MHTIFISDIHLHEENKELTQLFLNLLNALPKALDALYILGDLFELWLGDDAMSSYQQSIVNAIRDRTAEGLPIYFMHGNRDFLINTIFAKQSGVQLLAEHVVIDLYGKKTLLLHGDTLCTEDRQYQKYRKIVRHSFIQKLFLLIPVNIRKKIANHIRQRSKNYTSQVKLNLIDANNDAAIKLMQKNKVLQLIHGHTHRPAIHLNYIDDDLFSRYVLADWDKNGYLLIASNNGTLRFATLNLDSAIGLEILT